MTIKQEAMRAWDTDAVVRIQMQSDGCFEGLIGDCFSEIEGKPAVLLTSYNDEGEVTDHRHLPYEDITDICFVGEADRSYPHCDETECDFREGSGLYCKDKECVSRIILVDYAGSFCEDPKPGEEEPPADDVAMKKPDDMRTVCGKTLAFLKGQIDWNAEDMGSLGEYIKTEYVYNLIDDLEKALTSNRVRMNWPFLEESAQDGANREMDEEDAKAVESQHDEAEVGIRNRDRLR